METGGDDDISNLYYSFVVLTKNNLRNQAPKHKKGDNRWNDNNLTSADVKEKGKAHMCGAPALHNASWIYRSWIATWSLPLSVKLKVKCFAVSFDFDQKVHIKFKYISWMNKYWKQLWSNNWVQKQLLRWKISALFAK